MRKKDTIFSLPQPPPPKDCRNRTIWCCPSPLLRLLDGGMSLEHFVKRKRGEAERNEGGRVYRNIVIKKENCWWLWNITRKKMCGSFCHFLFFFFFYLMLLSLFLRGSIFPRWRFCFIVPVFVLILWFVWIYSVCSHHSKWVLAQKKVLSQLVIPPPQPPSLSAPSVADKKFGNST